MPQHFAKHQFVASVSADSNVVTHFCWDNFDLQEETVSGSGTTRSAHGNVIQELSATSAGY